MKSVIIKSVGCGKCDVFLAMLFFSLVFHDFFQWIAGHSLQCDEGFKTHVTLSRVWFTSCGELQPLTY